MIEAQPEKKYKDFGYTCKCCGCMVEEYSPSEQYGLPTNEFKCKNCGSITWLDFYQECPDCPTRFAAERMDQIGCKECEDKRRAYIESGQVCHWDCKCIFCR